LRGLGRILAEVVDSGKIDKAHMLVICCHHRQQARHGKHKHKHRQIASYRLRLDSARSTNAGKIADDRHAGCQHGLNGQCWEIQVIEHARDHDLPGHIHHDIY
jgi:hypothetical protein